MEHGVTDLSSTIELDIDRMVAGGFGLGRDVDGRIVLAEGALPGERVSVELTSSKPTMASGHVVEVIARSPGRIDPPCPEVAAGCGGCDLQFTPSTVQSTLKAGIVADALQRIGKLSGVPIVQGRRLPEFGYRTTLRCGIGMLGNGAAGAAGAAGTVGAGSPEHGVSERAGFRRRRSNQIHAVHTCLIAHPLVAEIVEHGRFPGADEVTIRAGARTAERLVIVTPRSGAATPTVAGEISGIVVPDGVRVVTTGELASGERVWFHEEVAGHRFRISARSFFQARPDGAEALVEAVARAIGPFDAASDRLVDLYGGVGLFSAALGARRAVLVERSASSVADARVNLAALDAEICGVAVEKWRPTEADVVVADPSRSGLGKTGVAAIVATGAERVALVSCDPAALGRDARLLVDAGFEVLGVEVVDLFPQTHHVEAVTTLRRVGAR